MEVCLTLRFRVKGPAVTMKMHFELSEHLDSVQHFNPSSFRFLTHFRAGHYLITFDRWLTKVNSQLSEHSDHTQHAVSSICGT